MGTTRSSRSAAQESEFKLILHKEKSGQQLIVLLAILAVYFCLAFYRLDHQSLWVDEVSSITRADPEGAFLERARWSSGHGPLYFRMLHLWAQWGTSEFALRSLSVLFGGIAVWLMYLMGLRLFNRHVAWLGALLLATSPFFIWYSQEVRYVMLMMAAALLAMYGFHLVVTTNRRGWGVFQCCSLILAIAAFVANIFLPITQGLYLLGSPARRLLLRRFVVCQLIVLALFVWWANNGYVDRFGGYWQRLFAHVSTSSEKAASIPVRERLVTGGSREFSVMALPYTFFTFSTGFSLGPSIRDLQVTRSPVALRPHVLILLICVLLFGGLFVSGIGALWRQPDTRNFLVVWLAVPAIGVLGVSALIPEMAYNVRYVAMGFPAYVLILAAGITALRRPLFQTSLLAAVLVINGFSLANYYDNPRYSREDARSAARFLEGAAHPRDLIVIVGNGTALKYYYQGNLALVDFGKKAIGNGLTVTDHLRELPANYDRIWLVEIRPWEADLKGVVKALLDDQYNRIEHRELPGVTINLYRM